jgi:AP-3 complex subunit beta
VILLKQVKRYFPAVVKNVAVNSFPVKRLIYIYLLRYAEYEPDLTLLSINQFQKGLIFLMADLNDSNPMIRTVALRVLCSIKVPIIMPISNVVLNIVTMSFKKCAVDLSPYVRKAVAVSLYKTLQMDSSQLPLLTEILVTLLNDNSTIVLGPAVSALNLICPDRYDLLHQHYTKLCRLLSEADEWGQIEIINTLIRYAHVCFRNPSELDRNSWHPDFALLVESFIPLLSSRNPTVFYLLI